MPYRMGSLSLHPTGVHALLDGQFKSAALMGPFTIKRRLYVCSTQWLMHNRTGCSMNNNNFSSGRPLETANNQWQTRHCLVSAEPTEIERAICGQSAWPNDGVLVHIFEDE
ncbi:hypothetical protein PoB_004517400 [Plakobranchus ocellatus]|uniref:Uncharacterized protein n=1 Tax=Plakobranchus ocellatus TaxID=259542 RepID=A0AAV4BIG7_9GAST|nr:hypothetical protein PoB_004517400 [Plakobranchus ocellatus]